MDRSRDRDERPPLDIPPEDRYGNSRGQSYRPNRSPPRPGFRPRSPPSRAPGFGSGYGPARGPPGRPRSRSPPPFRRRSRSPPPFRGRENDGLRPRPRSPPPPRRDFDRDAGFRGPPPRDVRDARDGPRFRDRSPPRVPGGRSPFANKRSRDASPSSSRGRFSPPPPKRERLNSPARPRYDQPPSRDRSPVRRRFSPPRDRRPSPPRGIVRDNYLDTRSPARPTNRPDPRTVDNWRRRSPSPRKTDTGPIERSQHTSGETSRRSSPPVHPSRLAVVTRADEQVRGIADVQPPPHPLAERRPPRPRSRSPPRYPPEQAQRTKDVAPRDGPLIPPDRLPQRAPPAGPTGANPPVDVPSGPSRAPPSGPKPPATSAPLGPRGGPPPQREAAPAAGPTSDFPIGPRSRGSGPPNVPFSRGQRDFPSAPYRNSEASPSSPAVPSGPRNAPPPPAYRTPSTPAAPSYPRAQRFAPNGAPMPISPSLGAGKRIANPYLANLPPILDEGKKLPPLFDRSRLDRLDEEMERMRKVMDEKNRAQRKSLREWERLGREVELAELRSMLAEESLVKLGGGEGAAAAF